MGGESAQKVRQRPPTTTHNILVPRAPEAAATPNTLSRSSTAEGFKDAKAKTADLELDCTLGSSRNDDDDDGYDYDAGVKLRVLLRNGTKPGRRTARLRR
ncbi:hypothetical protein ZHAS_00002987 [Anopheles sinensis]|uniref:Uncharacterized protein n=1 Tax=Anopheles sinensis TaxID=74873 RepID=A0A084VDE8_ANOSI|nr:hypothetical protein ZHAS_00002987 [Anopheles sinensis]